MSQSVLDNQAIAPEKAQQPESIAIDYYNYQVVLGDRLLAEITHDDSDFTTQRWVVKINGSECFRDTTVARCTSWVSWHYNQGTLPAHDEWKTAQEEVSHHIEEQVNAICASQQRFAIAPEPVELPATEVKVARQLKIGDKVVLDGEIWKLERINIQPVQYQSWHSEVHGVRESPHTAAKRLPVSTLPHVSRSGNRLERRSRSRMQRSRAVRDNCKVPFPLR